MEFTNASKSGNTFIIGLFLFITYSFNAQVGFGTDNPTTMLDINGALSLRQAEDALQLINPVDGVYNDIPLSSPPYSFYRIEGPTANFSLQSLQFITGGVGHLMFLQNGTEHDMTILHYQNPANPRQFYISSTRNVTFPGRYATFILQYSSENKWWLPGGLDPGGNIEITGNIPAEDSETFTHEVPGLTTESNFSVTIAGSAPATARDHLTIEYKGINLGNIIFRVKNASAQDYNALKFNILVFK